MLACYTIVRHHVNHPWRNDCNLFCISLLFWHQTSIKNKVKCGYLLSWWKKDPFFFSFRCEQVNNIVIHTQKTPSVSCKTLIIFPLFGAVSSKVKQHTINTICIIVRTWLASFFRMNPVFIQSWTIPRKYLRSTNLPIAISQIYGGHENVAIFTKKGSQHKKYWCIHPLWHFTYFSKHITSEI